MNKENKVKLFRTICKFVYVFLTITVFLWLTWNLVFVDTLGVGLSTPELWVFGLLTLSFFWFLRLLSPLWFVALKVSDFTIFALLDFIYLGLIYAL